MSKRKVKNCFLIHVFMQKEKEISFLYPFFRLMVFDIKKCQIRTEHGLDSDFSTSFGILNEKKMAKSLHLTAFYILPVSCLATVACFQEKAPLDS
jgi:hypothetical protein